MPGSLLPDSERVSETTADGFGQIPGVPSDQIEEALMKRRTGEGVSS